MKVIYSEDHRLHSPSSFMLRGERVPCPERPDRADIFYQAVARHERVLAMDLGDAQIRAVHDEDYLNYLENGVKDWSALDGATEEIIPNVHPNRNMSRRPEHIVGRAGYYQADTACPIGRGTYRAATAAAHCAIGAAKVVRNAQSGGIAYALCRPPGHHAYADMAGGFCYLNNSAIAAEYCRADGAERVAILDVDVHHGNGTQGIFYARDDVYTFSLHGDPNHYYPFYTGYEDETGIDAGSGANRNVTLSRGTGDAAYLDALLSVLDDIATYSPTVLIVALGLDASKEDPLAFLSLSTEGFARIAKAISTLNLPTVLIQEGGYISPVLGANLAAFLDEFEAPDR